jgi:anti-sigma B factor antagonist
LLEENNVNIHRQTINKDMHILKINQPLSGRCAEELEQKLADSRSFGAKTVVVDLEDVAYVDSRGLAALVAGYKMFGSNVLNFRLAAPQDQPRLLFELTMFDRIFRIFETVTDAVGVIPVQERLVRPVVPAFVSQPVA